MEVLLIGIVIAKVAVDVLFAIGAGFVFYRHFRIEIAEILHWHDS